MEIPDLVGIRLRNALDIIKKQCPMLECEVICYRFPRSGRRDDDALSVMKRVVRQRLIGNAKLELIVSCFKEVPDMV